MKICKRGERTWNGKAEWQARQVGHYSSLHLGRAEPPPTRQALGQAAAWCPCGCFLNSTLRVPESKGHTGRVAAPTQTAERSAGRVCTLPTNEASHVTCMDQLEGSMHIAL